ncbi:MAG: rod shape-determining protein [Alicyclobacillus sp.]|nr:rod shape-determining protein [Alicyclobacillus sp.]
MHIICDLGTSNFRAAMVGGDRILCEPSVIAMDRDRGVTVGSKAHEMIGRNPDVIKIVSPIEEGVIRDIEAAAEMIRYSARQFGGGGRMARKFSLTMSIPSELTQVETRALEDAARLAGAKNVRFMNACVAGAIGAGLPVEGPNGCLVVNLGGGVTEVSLLSLKGIVSSHTVRRGGQAINEAIIDRLRKDHAFHVGLLSAETLKRCAYEHVDWQTFEVRGRDLATGLPRSVHVPRSVVDAPLAAYVDSIVDLISAVITECPPEFAGDIIQRGIVLIGGGAKVQGLAAQLRERLEAPVVTSDDPDTAVIRGMMIAEMRAAGKFGVNGFRKRFAPNVTGSANDPKAHAKVPS